MPSAASAHSTTGSAPGVLPDNGQHGVTGVAVAPDGRRVMQKKRRRRFAPMMLGMLGVVMGLGLLVAMTLPWGISYRSKSLVAGAVSTAEGMRAALASYAADSQDNRFPPASAMTNWDGIVRIVKANGGTLPAQASALHITQVEYATPADGSSYALTLRVHVSKGTLGRTLVVTPEGITTHE